MTRWQRWILVVVLWSVGAAVMMDPNQSLWLRAGGFIVFGLGVNIILELMRRSSGDE